MVTSMTVTPSIRRITHTETTHFTHRETISYIVPTIGRTTLQRALDSIELQPGDEILINHPETPYGTWGYTERNELLPYARCAWLAFIDDDDYFLPGYRAHMTDAMRTVPGGRDVPIIFKMRFAGGKELWKDRIRDPNRPDRPDLVCNNVGTPMLLMPNLPWMLARFNETRYVGDFDFIHSCKWPRRMIYWRPEVIVQVGNDPRGVQQ